MRFLAPNALLQGEEKVVDEVEEGGAAQICLGLDCHDSLDLGISFQAGCHRKV